MSKIYHLKHKENINGYNHKIRSHIDKDNLDSEDNLNKRNKSIVLSLKSRQDWLE